VAANAGGLDSRRLSESGFVPTWKDGDDLLYPRVR
jgi:hypothetical protein